MLVDSPRFTAPLVRRPPPQGAWRYRDDVPHPLRRRGRPREVRAPLRRPASADARRRRPRDRRIAGVEIQPDGEDPIPLADDLLLFPTPGHTHGSACQLWRDVLFTGDTLSCDTDADATYAFDDASWYDWGVLLDSLPTPAFNPELR